MPQNKVNIFKVLIVFTSLMTSANAKNQELLTWEHLPFKSSVKKSLYDDNDIYSTSHVTSDKTTQSLNTIAAGLHSKKCSIALSKISQYGNYQRYIGFIKQSTYDKNNYIKLYIDHLLMPYPMVLYFKLDPITKPGNYNFTFEHGFLKELKGLIRVSEHKNRCLFLVSSNWKGKKTDIPDKIFSFFTEVLIEKLMKKLFMISQTL